MNIELNKIPEEEVLRYIGAPRTDDSALIKQVRDCIDQVLRAARAKWVYRVFDIAQAPEGVMLDSGLLLGGRDIKKHLKSCNRAALMAVTISSGVDGLVRRAEAQDMLTAVIMDSCGSAAIEAACDIAEESIKEQFPGCSFPYRFSPGYGDLPIDLQRDILNLLDAPRKIGLCVTDSNILTPRKSVTALLGISKGVSELEKRGCASCQFKGSCRFQCKEN